MKNKNNYIPTIYLSKIKIYEYKNVMVKDEQVKSLNSAAQKKRIWGTRKQTGN